MTSAFRASSFGWQLDILSLILQLKEIVSFTICYLMSFFFLFVLLACLFERKVIRQNFQEGWENCIQYTSVYRDSCVISNTTRPTMKVIVVDTIITLYLYMKEFSKFVWGTKCHELKLCLQSNDLILNVDLVFCWSYVDNQYWSHSCTHMQIPTRMNRMLVAIL